MNKVALFSVGFKSIMTDPEIKIILYNFGRKRLLINLATQESSLGFMAFVFYKKIIYWENASDKNTSMESSITKEMIH